ncbi:cytochrome c-type biogenesis protein CcsB [Geobacter metallireducens RCH3]|uniref:Heme exporter protein C n=1 Tax=Geobacter metallireducens (strain ATCC 53774 / DSM 7210 / GS-15) TaxID=269799 RepID=Q39QM9_GEOMG|nr:MULTISPECIES: c-type cytochrome biogenesis protein CcsB [Geobacter]ABB33445.1 ResC/HemX-like cytochrome c [Geobacter metallireducens GS-15]EHP87498.1 cytochrome c-type biogenesis protein CcsB [Geobacter metallireducens RCH3]MBT1074728.1 c-type cytochrome biogenesis protein CcsB [Geobacter grbiciae]
MNALFFKLTLAIYFAATIAYLAYLVKPREVLGKVSCWILSAGFVAHCAYTVDRYLEAGHTPITNLHESLSFFSLAVVGIYILFERKYRIFILGSFVTPVAFLLMAASTGFPSAIMPLNPALKSKWLMVHTVMAFLSYAAFSVAFGAAIMYLIQQHFLKSKKLGPMYQKLPSLDILDEINYRCLTIGFPLLTFAIISGAIWAESAWGTYWSWDPKETWSLITWFVYAALLHGRLTTGWRGKKAAILAIVGFFVLLFTFLGVNLFLSGLHSYK